MMKFKSLFRRGPSGSSKHQDGRLKGAPSISSLDSKHHKVAPGGEKSSKIFGSKEKIAKGSKKKDIRDASNNNAVPEEEERMRHVYSQDIDDDFHIPEGREELTGNQYGSADELSYPMRGPHGISDLRDSLEMVGTGEKSHGVGFHQNVDQINDFASLPVTISTAEHQGSGNVFKDSDLYATSETALITSMMQEVDDYRRSMESAAADKLALQARVHELEQLAAQAGELRVELDKMKALERQRLQSLERLADENGALRARLRGVAHSPLSDSEKRQLLMEPPLTPRVHSQHHRMHSSAPASIAAVGMENDSNDVSTPDWDKHSSSSLSEVSVACLQDRILQMEENHYSTSEELAATLAELTELQSQLAVAQTDNERLVDEKQVLLESLCRQTERLEDSRTKVDTLQELLLRDNGDGDTGVITEREQKLILLLKIAQEERESYLAKHEELLSELADVRMCFEQQEKRSEDLLERIKVAEAEAEEARGLAAAKHQHASHLSESLKFSNNKIAQLEIELRNRSTPSTPPAVPTPNPTPDEALLERLTITQRQLDRLNVDYRKAIEDANASRNSAISTISELEYQVEQLKQEKTSLHDEIQGHQNTVTELQMQCQLLQDEKRALTNRMGEALARTGEAERAARDARDQITQISRERERDEAEWKQFQSDLLVTVRVANDFKTEAQKELERLISENKTARDKIRHLEQQIEKMNVITPPLPRNEEPSLASVTLSQPLPPPLLTSASLQDIMAQTQRRNKTTLSRQDSRLSVKSLIESIENAAKVAKQQQAVAPNATNSTTGSNLASNASSLAGSAPPSPVSDWPLNIKSPLMDQGGSLSKTTTSNGISASLGIQGLTNPSSNGFNPVNGGKSTSTAVQPGGLSPRGIIINEQLKQDYVTSNAAPNHKVCSNKMTNMSDDQASNMQVLLQHNKAMETFARRNSYGDLCERKDPLNALVKNGGSKRNALLKWCQQKTQGYKHIDITNFSSSWNDGLALCALLHSYLPERVPYDSLVPADKRRNFTVAFSAAESIGISTTLNIQDMIQLERPDWQQVMAYVTNIYKHFET